MYIVCVIKKIKNFCYIIIVIETH